MPKAKYDYIYNDLKEKIENEIYKEGTFLPSENTLIQLYKCSRNTIRRAISPLTLKGYVQPQHGKGVRVLYTPCEAAENNLSASIKVILFTDMNITESLSKKTGFPVGTSIYYVKQVHYIDGIAKMVDTRMLRKDRTSGLTQENADNFRIETKTVKQTITVEKASAADEKYMELNNYNCLPVVTSKYYNQNGILFEYTESRNRPDLFAYNSVNSNSF